MRKGAVKPLFYGIGNCSCSSGTPPRIAIAILGVQSAGFAFFVEEETARAVVVHQQELQ